MRSDPDDATIRSYLLGRLPEPEAEALEEAYLAQPEVWERVRGVEDDLLDDYAAGQLGPDDKGAFESRCLVSPYLRQRVVAARALRQAARSARAGPRAIVARRMRWLGPLAVAAGMLLALVAFWKSPPRSPQMTSASVPPTSAVPTEAPPSSEPARPTPPSGSPAAKATPESGVRSVVLALSPAVLLRGRGQPAELSIPAGTDTVVFELEGDPAAVPRSARSLEVIVETVEGTPIWRGAAQGATGAGRPSLLASARVPATRLPPGDYVLTLSGRGEGTLSSYFLRVRDRRPRVSPVNTP